MGRHSEHSSSRDKGFANIEEIRWEAMMVNPRHTILRKFACDRKYASEFGVTMQTHHYDAGALDCALKCMGDQAGAR